MEKKAKMETEKLLRHQIAQVFRRESGSLVAGLTRVFGVQGLELAEDVVQDSLMEAMDKWIVRGMPENPVGWLYTVARNKALNVLKREHLSGKYAHDSLFHDQRHAMNVDGANEWADWGTHTDESLRLMFICCHPLLSSDSQIALTLKTLCGFGIPEIARAFLVTESSVEKRLVRARQALKKTKIPFEFPEEIELQNRLRTVLGVIYLMFNEGYSASVGDDVVRPVLCTEAIRLATVIKNNPQFREEPDVHALMSLMQLNTSRFEARQDPEGAILTLEHQDRTLWDRELIAQGLENLRASAGSIALTEYHLLAGISAFHCTAPDYASTNWQGILELYDKLVQLDGSAIVHLNRSIAVHKVHGAEHALEYLDNLSNTDSLLKYYLYYAVRAEFLMDLQRFELVISALEIALFLAPMAKERELLLKKLQDCRSEMKIVI